MSKIISHSNRQIQNVKHFTGQLFWSLQRHQCRGRKKTKDCCRLKRDEKDLTLFDEPSLIPGLKIFLSFLKTIAKI